MNRITGIVVATFFGIMFLFVFVLSPLSHADKTIKQTVQVKKKASGKLVKKVKCRKGICLNDKVVVYRNKRFKHDVVSRVKAFPKKPGLVRLGNGKVVSIHNIKKEISENKCLATKVCRGDYLFTVVGPNKEVKKGRVVELYPKGRVILDVNYDEMNNRSVVRIFNKKNANYHLAMKNHPDGNIFQRLVNYIFGPNKDADSKVQTKETVPAR